MPKKETILVICAHSDDHILGAGGTIAQYAAEGKRVRVIVLSYGEKSHPWLRPRFTKDIRERETHHADRIVGCRSTFFDLKEGSFPGGFAAIKGQLLALVKNLKPRKVFTHTNEDPHPDHLATHAITLEVLQEARVKAEVYLFSIWNPFSLRKSHAPRLYVDTTHTFGKKIRAIRHFQSQRPAMLVLLWGILARELKNGLHIGTRIAECFYRIQ